MVDSLKYLRDSGRWLRLTCWQCGHAKQFWPADLEKLLGRKGWDESLWHFASRSVCACGARSPAREIEWRDEDRPLWAKLAFPRDCDDPEELAKELGQRMRDRIGRK